MDVGGAKGGRQGRLLQLLQHGVIELAVGFNFALKDAILNLLAAFAGDDGALGGVLLREELLLTGRLIRFILNALQDVLTSAIQGVLERRNLDQDTLDSLVVILVGGTLKGELAVEVGELILILA